MYLKGRITEMTAELGKDKETLISISPNASRNTQFQQRAHQFIVTSHLIDILAFYDYYLLCHLPMCQESLTGGGRHASRLSILQKAGKE